jgi:hypothetical protein
MTCRGASLAEAVRERKRRSEEMRKKQLEPDAIFITKS